MNMKPTVSKPKGTQPNHYVTSTDNHVQPIPSSVLDKIMKESKAKAKAYLEKKKEDAKFPAYMRHRD